MNATEVWEIAVFICEQRSEHKAAKELVVHKRDMLDLIREDVHDCILMMDYAKVANDLADTAIKVTNG